MAKKTRGAVEQEWLAAHECASRIGLTVRALRLYEQRGLIRPRRTDKGWRLYGAGEIARLHEILALKRLGLSLSSIVALLQGKAIDLERTLTLQSQALSRQRVRAERDSRSSRPRGRRSLPATRSPSRISSRSQRRPI